MPQPPQQTPEAMAERAHKRRDRLRRQLELTAGHSVLEVGCGRGHLTRRVADDLEVDAVGLDVQAYDEWGAQSGGRARFIEGDVSQSLGLQGRFDRIYSLSVWEHLEHPAAAMEQCFDMLKPGGMMFLQAQLMGGPKASHRYREVFFPWPHLLFTPAVFEEFYIATGHPPRRPAWINSWSALHYRFHIDRVGFETRWFSTPNPWFDEAFYNDHIEILGAYPRWDLSHDAVMIRVRKPSE